MIGSMSFEKKGAILWEPGGSGTFYLSRGERDRLVFVQFWADRELSDQEITSFSESDTNDPISKVSLQVPSGILLAIWSAEDVTRVSLPSEPSAAIKGLALGDGGWKFSVDEGEYVASTHHYVIGDVEVAALRIEKSN